MLMAVSMPWLGTPPIRACSLRRAMIRMSGCEYFNLPSVAPRVSFFFPPANVRIQMVQRKFPPPGFEPASRPIEPQSRVEHRSSVWFRGRRVEHSSAGTTAVNWDLVRWGECAFFVCGKGFYLLLMENFVMFCSWLRIALVPPHTNTHTHTGAYQKETEESFAVPAKAGGVFR